MNAPMDHQQVPNQKKLVFAIDPSSLDLSRHTTPNKCNPPLFHMRSPTPKKEEKGLTQNPNSQLGYNTL
jgi:hypothetical protein